jgi:hypothetical protein
MDSGLQTTPALLTSAAQGMGHGTSMGPGHLTNSDPETLSLIHPGPAPIEFHTPGTDQMHTVSGGLPRVTCGPVLMTPTHHQPRRGGQYCARSSEEMALLRSSQRL